jgi:hypothetical protein
MAWCMCCGCRSRTPAPIRCASLSATRHSGALGSVGEFVQIDDVAKGDFALSGIVIGENNAANVRPAEGLDAAGLLRQQARGSLRREPI